MAFGTGSHPTTRLCLEWLSEAVTPDCSVLDYGCGSGILGIAAARLGAGSVLGMDIDEKALEAAADNAARNRVSLKLQHSTAPLEAQYQLVVANILTNPLCVLAPAIAARVAPGGRLALSGVLVTQAEQVIAAYAPSSRSRWGNRRRLGTPGRYPPMMLTRCPACQTAFRVRPEQLRLRQGRVRCGSCGKAFNALATLFDEAQAQADDAGAIPDPQHDQGAGQQMIDEQVLAPHAEAETEAEAGTGRRATRLRPRPIRFSLRPPRQAAMFSCWRRRPGWSCRTTLTHDPYTPITPTTPPTS